MFELSEALVEQSVPRALLLTASAANPLGVDALQVEDKLGAEVLLVTLELSQCCRMLWLTV